MPTKEAERKLRDLDVAAIYLFGSRAYEISSPISDFDFGILLNNPERVKENSLEMYNALYDILSPLTRPETLAADVIDIVFLDSPRVPLELKAHIVRHGKLIFDANPRRRVDAEEYLMEAYCDFRPLLDLFDRALLAKI